MTSEEKQTELKRHRDIIFATIDYLLEQTAGSLIFDEFDPVTDYYQRAKQQTEKYYQKGRLDRLQQRLHSITENPRHTGDLRFGSYIREKTGYDIDIFESLRNRIDTIIEQKEIKNQKELRDVSTMLNVYQQTPGDQKKIDILNNLLIDFAKRTSKPKSSRKNKHLSNQLSEAYSPDHQRKLIVAKSGTDENNASTYVVIQFEHASGPIFGTRGINPNINAYWKDNSTIVIETKKDYIVVTQCEQVQSFQDIVKIEYIES